MFEKLLGTTGFSLDRLRALCDIAEKGSIAEATRGDTNRQTQYSRQIRELETFFRVDLLDREARPHRLTPAGIELAKMTREFLGNVEGFLARCQGRPESLAIGTGESIGRGDEEFARMRRIQNEKSDIERGAQKLSEVVNSAPGKAGEAIVAEV